MSSDEAALLCARRYAHTYGLSEVGDLLGKSAEVSIGRSERGKPYFIGIPADMTQLHFSLSHSGLYGACAVHTGPLGLDIQEHRPCDKEAIARRFFHSTEYDFLVRYDFEPFFDIWTAKESYVKYTGEGLAGGLGAFSVVDEMGFVTDLGMVRLLRIGFQELYSMYLCAEDNPAVIVETI